VQLKPGQRLRSQVCGTQVIIVHPADTDVVLKCGGSPMVDLDSDVQSDSAPQEGLAGGNEMGKRYTTQDGSLEVLVTKAGVGTLAVGDDPLQIKGVKPLPSSD
jgi:hypothetical protein